MKEINLENSYFFFNSDADCWRADIQSVLINEDENKTYYLVKECRAEEISKNPFQLTDKNKKTHNGRYEFLVIAENGGMKHFFRSPSIYNQGVYLKTDLKRIQPEIMEELDEIKSLKPEEVLEILRKREKINIFCKIQYELKQTTYSLISKCKFINFSDNSGKRENYLQPILGYLPFEMDGKIYVSYAAKYLSPQMDGDLDFLLRVGSTIFEYKKNDFLRNIIKFASNKLLFYTKKNEFQKCISIKKSKIFFFNFA